MHAARCTATAAQVGGAAAHRASDGCSRRRRVPRPATACDRPRAKLVTGRDRFACRPMQPLWRAREFPEPLTCRVAAARDADACDRYRDHRRVRRRSAERGAASRGGLQQQRRARLPLVGGRSPSQKRRSATHPPRDWDRPSPPHAAPVIFPEVLGFTFPLTLCTYIHSRYS